MNYLEGFADFLPNISITESPGALVFPSRRIWDELRSNRSSLLLAGPYAFEKMFQSSNIVEALLKLCLIGGVKLVPEDNKMSGRLQSEWQWTYRDFAWDPADFDGVEQLIVPRDKIWTPYIAWRYYVPMVRSSRPDVVLESKYSGTERFLEVRSLIDDFDGSWNCKESTVPYPFDVLECELSFTISGSSVLKNLRLQGQSECGDGLSQRKRHGEFDFVGQEFRLNDRGGGIEYTLRFARNPSRIMTTVIRPAAWLTLLNAFSYRVQTGRVSFCCLLMISSTIVSMSFFRGIQAKTDRIPQIAVMIFCSTLWIFVGLALAILSEDFPGSGRKTRNYKGYAKWILLVPSAFLFLWLMIQ